MQVLVQLPDEVAKQLGPHAEIPRRILEAVALEGYRERRLSQAQVAHMLDLSRWQAEEFLDKHEVRRPYTSEMLEEDRQTLAKLPPR